MEFQDKTLKCIDCGADFVFTAGEQLFFHDKQFKNEPKRCKPCKAKRAATLGNGAATGNGAPTNYSKVETRTTCSQCGKETTVPLLPGASGIGSQRIAAPEQTSGNLQRTRVDTCVPQKTKARANPCLSCIPN